MCDYRLSKRLGQQPVFLTGQYALSLSLVIPENRCKIKTTCTATLRGEFEWRYFLAVERESSVPADRERRIGPRRTLNGGMDASVGHAAVHSARTVPSRSRTAGTLVLCIAGTTTTAGRSFMCASISGALRHNPVARSPPITPTPPRSPFQPTHAWTTHANPRITPVQV